MLSMWRARLIEETLLSDKGEWSLRGFSARHVALGIRNFGNRPAEMNRAGTPACFGFPRDRRRQRVIDFKNSWRVPEILQPTTVTARQSIAGDPRELPGR